MCKIYNASPPPQGDHYHHPQPHTVRLNRSVSFDHGRSHRRAAASVAEVVDHGGHSPVSTAESSASSTDEHSSSSMSCPSSSDKACTTEEEAETKSKGGFRLFRSRSWSLRRKRNNNHQESSSKEPKRCSPGGGSTKSQDSGFSDNEVAARPKATRTTGTSMREEEDEEDPNLTQVPTALQQQQQQRLLSAQEGQRRQREWLMAQCNGSRGATPTGRSSRSATLPAHSQQPMSLDSVPRERVASSVGNIASMQEGLRLKARLCEEGDGDEAEAAEEGGRRRLSTSWNLLRVPGEQEEEDGADKARKQV